MKTLVLRILGLLSILALVGCGRPFKVETAPGFVPLENQSGYSYDYRATTPEGVVVAIRVIDDEERGDLAFWTQALTLQLRDVSGYALLETTDTRSRDGTKGKLLKLGHDEDGKPFTYWVGVYLAQGRLFIVEAGGQKDAFERAKPNVEWMLASVKVKCDTFVSPVLASRTCNKW
ncbi:MAG: serine/threonine protein kinase [Labilithrix sp.]